MLARLLVSVCSQQRQYGPYLWHVYGGDTNPTDTETVTQQWHHASALVLLVEGSVQCVCVWLMSGLMASLCVRPSVQVASRSARQKSASPSSTLRTSLWRRPGSARPDGMKQQSVGRKGERQERSGWRREPLAWKLLLCNKVSLCFFSLLPLPFQQVKCEFLSSIVWWSELSALNPNES